MTSIFFFSILFPKLASSQLTENKCINKISVNYLQKIELQSFELKKKYYFRSE